jgi:CRP-like cAMP-binding protein
LNELPQGLKLELALLMNKQIIKKVYFFKDKPPYFIAFVGPLLKPVRVEANQHIYKSGDPIDAIFFLTRGKASFVTPMPILSGNGEESGLSEELPYLIIEAGYYFGEIDFVYHNFEL